MDCGQPVHRTNHKVIMKIYYLFIALFFCHLCAGKTSIRSIDLEEYPSQSVEFDDIGIVFQRISQTHETDTLRIVDNLFSIFRLAYIDKASGPEYEMEADECYGTVSILQNQTILLQKDSIAMIGPFDHSFQNDKLIAPLILYQNPDNLDTAVDLYLIDVRKRNYSKINNEPLFNSIYGTITDDGNSIIYGSFGKLYKYNIGTEISESVIDFNNPTLFIFKLTYENDTLTIYYYNNFVEDALLPIQKRTIPNIVL